MNRDDLLELLPPFLAQQRWFGSTDAGSIKVRLQDFEVMRDAWPKLVWALVEFDGAVNHLFLEFRNLSELAAGGDDEFEFVGGVNSASAAGGLCAEKS